jgi:hypothetical protein
MKCSVHGADVMRDTGAFDSQAVVFYGFEVG